MSIQSAANQKETAPSTQTEEPVWYIITNKTAQRIEIEPLSQAPNAAPFIIPPFGKREVLLRDFETQFDYKGWEQRNFIAVDKKETAAKRYENLGDVMIGLFVWVFIIAVIVGLLVEPLRGNWLYWVLVVVSLVVVIVTGLLIRFGLFSPLFQRIFQIFQWIIQTLSFVTILFIGIFIPAIVIYFLGGRDELLSFQPSQTPNIPFTLPFVIQVKPTLFFLGRSLQWVFIAIAATLPALLYFLFDRLRVDTLRENFFREVLFLNPNLQTTDDAQSLYGRMVDEVYGSGSDNRFLGGARLPIVICTILITLGWLLTVLPFGPTKELQPNALLNLFAPQLTPVTLGFLGAYFFGLQMVFRRYVQSDLGPKAYTNITVRLLVTVILVWVVTILSHPGGNLETLISGAATPVPNATLSPSIGATSTITATIVAPTATSSAATATPTPTKSPGAASAETPPPEPPVALLILAFFIGIVPETAFQTFREAQQWIGKVFNFSALIEEYPLSDLEGVSLYDRARLLEEGIENIENLAHHNFVELMLRTRIPTSRLVDLVDQAILYLHTKGLEKPKSNGQTAHSALKTLREYGIRTATDLEKAYDAEKDNLNNFLALLDPRDPPDSKVKRLEIILATLKDDEWMAHIRRWRETHEVSDDRSYKLNEVIRATDRSNHQP